MLCKTPYIPYPNFFKFCPTPVTNRFQASSPLLFLRPCFFGWMGDCATFDVLFYPNDIMGLYMRSVGTLILEGRCYVFYEKKVYWGLTHNVVFYWYSDLISHTYKPKDMHHTQGPIDWYTHVNIYLHQLPCAHSSCLYYTE